MKKYLPYVAVFVVALGVGGYFAGWFGGSTPTAALDEPIELIVDPNVPEMILGEEGAPITVVEYASYTCPHCRRFHEDVFPDFRANYIDTGKVKFVYREVYFDRFGLWASMIARCGGEEKFFGITDLLYKQQREWAQGDPAVIADNLRRIGRTAGIDQASLDACLDDGDNAQNLVAWFEANVARDGITATPSFVIDGVKYSNMSAADLTALMDSKL